MSGRNSDVEETEKVDTDSQLSALSQSDGRPWDLAIRLGIIFSLQSRTIIQQMVPFRKWDRVGWHYVSQVLAATQNKAIIKVSIQNGRVTLDFEASYTALVKSERCNRNYTLEWNLVNCTSILEVASLGVCMDLQLVDIKEVFSSC